MKKQNKEVESIDIDSIEEIREVLKYAIKSRSWMEVEDTLELLNEILGHDSFEEEVDDRKNHMEE
jgi:hypothetical protein